MRGISAIIAVVLILLITISLAAGAYLFLSMTMSQTTTAAQQGISQTMTQMTKSFTIEAVDGPRISIRNTGQAQLSNFSVYVDNIPVNTSQVSIAPDEVKTILIYDFIDFSQSREIKVVSGTLAQTKIVSKQDSSLVGYWKFDEGSGTTAADSSGKGNDGTISGAMWDIGKYGSALKFDTGNYVDLPNNLWYTTQVSAFAWFKANGTPAGGYHIIFGGQELEISIPSSTGEIRTGVYTNQRYVSNHGSGLTDSKWHYIGFTFDGSTKKSYIDGVFVGEQAVSGSLTYSFAYRRIGRFGSSTTYYANGTIDEVRIYNRALTPEEIWNHYARGPV